MWPNSARLILTGCRCSPRRPKTAEAFVLHFADNIDAKMNQIFGTFDDETDAAGTWSPYVRTLERYLYNPPRTPRPVAEKAPKPKEKDAHQCLLPLKA